MNKETAYTNKIIVINNITSAMKIAKIEQWVLMTGCLFEK